MRLTRLLIVSLLISLINGSAWALDGFTLAYGQGSPNHLNIYMVGAQWDWDTKLNFGDGWGMTGLWNFDAGYWTGRGDQTGNNRAITIFSFTPNLVIGKLTPFANGWAPYIGAGVGPAFYTHHQLGDAKLGSWWGFQNDFFAGTRFGDQSQYDFGYHYIFFSNYGIYKNTNRVTGNWIVAFTYHLT